MMPSPYMGAAGFRRKGNWGMYIDSGLERYLRRINNGIKPVEQCYLYGDPAYALSYGIISGYKATVGSPLDPILKAINRHMSSMHLSSFNGFKGNLKNGLSPINRYFLVACFLFNIHSCLY
ncbi:hypothetical protein L873DRAFT_1812479 [Choiromyces venosus 120613-1]|uniref:DDE Tnp4 domain-containing protein n=1 Tax=Choiromyces venosus 120613-1 TaxID=1336337 RepID=A0A3N4JBT7_9PEZI|nr:hypothetical protein L873DRAFT_1812479 [Choiromyces venosus 120613-1]